MSPPSLLLLAEGRRAKPRKAPPIVRPREIILHMQVAKLLRTYARADWQFTHVPNGEVRDKRTAAKLKQMGTRAGWPDFILIPPHGLLHCLELKRIGEKLTGEQNLFRKWCIANGIPHVVAFTLDEVLAAFADWGCLTIKLSPKEASYVVSAS